jgi:hypothetical protein
MNAGAGRDMNWFWKNWFFEKNIPDLEITTVSREKQQYRVVVTNKGSAIVPVHLVAYFEDGSSQPINFSIACWAKGNKTILAYFKTEKYISKIVLGNPYDADIDPKNNIWIAAAH